MCHQKGGCNVSFTLKKIKKQNAYPCKFQKKKKNESATVSLSQMCCSKIFVTKQKLLRTLKIHYKIFDNSHLKFG